MNPDSRSRYSLSIVAAVLPTLALFYLMTRLIVPEEGDPTVTKMIVAFELRRVPRMVESAVRRRELELQKLQEFPRPKRPDFLTDQPQERTESGMDAPDQTDSTADNVENLSKSYVDWWQQIEKHVGEMSESDLRQWRLSNGYDKYVSMMQGSNPSSPYPEPERLTVDPLGTAYEGSSGKTELKISENCILEIDYSALAGTDPGKRIPPRIDCKRRRFSFDKDDLNY